VASANTFNQILEIKHDAKMSRTNNRPLVKSRISKTHALNFGLITGAFGPMLLYSDVTLLPAFLGCSNILLYALIYTPLKRYSTWNTFVGSIVGAIPPLIGYTALSHSIDANSLLLASILFTWQFPHFNALSHSIRHEYQKAGYHMLASKNPQLNASIAFLTSMSLIPICVGMSLNGLTDNLFMLTSMGPNLWMSYWAYKFWRQKEQRDKNAKRLFYASLFHLPMIILLMMYHKRRWVDSSTTASTAQHLKDDDKKEVEP
jgi:heme o synthase